MTKHFITATIYDKRGRVLSIGYNSYTKSHPKQAKLAAKVGKPNSIYLHAEIAALIKLKGTTVPFSILVVRFNKQGMPAMAAPCLICQKALKLAGITNILHT